MIIMQMQWEQSQQLGGILGEVKEFGKKINNVVPESGIFFF